MPSVLVVPVYVEIPSGVERAVMALESHLRRAGYVFRTGEPVQLNYECINPALGANRPSVEHHHSHIGTGNISLSCGESSGD
jgi:hypothetical protein